MGEPKENIGPLTVDSLLAAARAELHRLSPAEATVAVARGARLVDTRPHFQRAADDEIRARSSSNATIWNGVSTLPA
ncbi:hypothetical protein [Microbispora sp. CA-102843]|uniref:hypothetical protein n=1 Tax=Microbispora sp. CA-102843 TaxID=3239952 RepID=UPI003D8A6CE6